MIVNNRETSSNSGGSLFILSLFTRLKLVAVILMTTDG